MSVKYALYRLMAAVIVAGLLAAPGPLRAQAAPPEKPEEGRALSQTLLSSFEAGIDQVQDDLKEWESRQAATADRLAQANRELARLQVKVASLKATMVLKKLPLLRVQELLAAFGSREKELKKAIKEKDHEIVSLTQDRQTHMESQNALRMQLGIIGVHDPEALPPEIQASFLKYLDLTRRRDDLLVRVIDQLEKQRNMLQQEYDLLAALTPQLKQLEEVWKTELLKRPSEVVPIWDQVPKVYRSLTALPERGRDWLADLVQSGRLGAFVWTHVTLIVGLLSCIILLAWSTRRLKLLVIRRFRTWKAQTDDLHVLSIFVLGHILADNLFGLGLIIWLGLFFWTFSLLGSEVAQLMLAILVAFWALRLSRQVVRKFFASQPGKGVLSLDAGVARFYRRSLQFFLAYFFLGLFGLKAAALLNFPASSRLFLEQCFLVGVLVWAMWLLRRSYLPQLLQQLSEPAWLHRPVVSLLVRGLVLSVLVVVILAHLVGFQNLSLYLARAAVWTLLGLLVVWFLWLVGEILLHHLLHPETGWATYFFPERGELIQRIFVLSRWVLALALGTVVVLWSLNSWGIPPDQVAGAFQWMTWGPSLGPIKLTTLSLLGVSLVLYLGFFLSRVVRGLMLVRIFPRTALDQGLQYTISTTLHYVMLILAGLIALNILGFPLTNLALVAGALGVGIGFGLQNIVNNFLSGLILLFERPVKVGDLLVIDGQWGLVKEIRVRSTIFETFDRSVLIIPNSELVSNKVTNWTHYGAGINRLTLKVGVAYGSDVGQVTQLITAICQANPRVVGEPPPQVFFTVYGDSALEFTIMVHVSLPSDRMPATHELNRAIIETFQAHGIEIPFPQRDLHIKGWPAAPMKPEEG